MMNTLRATTKEEAAETGTEIACHLHRVITPHRTEDAKLLSALPRPPLRQSPAK